MEALAKEGLSLSEYLRNLVYTDMKERFGYDGETYHKPRWEKGGVKP